jgi:Ulp1 family protease
MLARFPHGEHLDTDIIFPINENSNHWLLGLVDTANRCIYVLDPLGVGIRHTGLERKLLAWVQAEYVACGRPDPGSWQIVSNDTAPMQTDYTSCGVMVAFYAYYWITERRLPTTADFICADVPALRLFMGHLLQTHMVH